MTFIGHALCGAAAYSWARPRRWFPAGPRFTIAVIAACVFLPAAPDLDAIAFLLGIPYSHPLGHRGVSHSIGLGLLLGAALATLAAWRGWIRPSAGARFKVAALVIVLWTSHGVLDAMTTGGKPILLFAPVSWKRVWAPPPLRLVPVSPIGGLGLLNPSADRSKASLERLRKLRAAVASRRHPSEALARMFISLDNRTETTGALYLLGVIGTEVCYVLPLWLLAVAWRRRRPLPQEDWPETPEVARAAEPQEAWPPPPSCGALRAIGGVLALGALAGAGVHLWKQRDISVERRVLDNASRTPYLAVRPNDLRTDVTAILMHGWRMSSNAMLPLARFLARNGISSYALDSLGQGASTAPTRMSCTDPRETPYSCRWERELGLYDDNVPSIRRLIEREQVDPKRAVLIGHSVGGALFPHIAARDADLDRSLWARINLEGRTKNLPAGGNHLFVGRRVLIREAPVAPPGVILVSGQRYGHFEDRSAYELLIIQRSHNQMVHDERVNREMVRWIEGAFDIKLPGLVEPDFLRAVFIAMLLGLAAFPLCALIARALARRMPRPPPATSRGDAMRNAWMALALMACASLCVVAISWPTRHVSALLRMTTTRFQVVPYVVLVGVVGLGLWALFGRPRAWTTTSPARWPVLAAPVGFLLLYLGAGLFVGSQFFHTILHPARMPRMLYLSACFLPLALLLSLWIRGRPTYGAQLFAAPVSGLAWLTCFTLMATAWERPMRFEALALGGLALAAELLATPLYVELRSPQASALLVALTLGWFTSVAYPLLP